MLCPVLLTDVVEEYGGGGPEYVVGGLLIVLLGSGNRLRSIFSIRYLSKSKLVIDGKASLLGESQHMQWNCPYQYIPLPNGGLERCHCFDQRCSGYA